MFNAARCAQWLHSPRAPWVAILIGTILTLPSIGPYLAFDDYVLGLAARGHPSIPGFVQNQFDLFTFTTGRSEDNRALMDQGFLLPWWTDESLRIAFFRPIASATHRLDFALWPGSPAMMHAHSVLWFSLALGAVALLFRRLEESPSIAALASLVYAVDDAHGPAVSWVSNRNALIATALGCCCIAWHHEWRSTGRRVFAALAAVSLGLGLLSGEFALGAGAYLIAYAVCCERGSVGRRFGTLIPYAAVLLLWRVGHQAGGFGAQGSGAYVDPFRDPSAFLFALPARIMILLHGQLGAPPADLAFIGPPEHRPLLLALSVVTLWAAFVVFSPILRADRRARFWALGAVLAVLPVSASFPSDRLLLFVGIGACGLLARLFSALLEQRLAKRLQVMVAVGFAALHLVVAPAFLPLRAAQMLVAGRAGARSALVLDGVEGLKDKTAIIVNAPADIFASYVQAQRAWFEQERPAHLYWLASASSDLGVERTARGSVRVRPARGFLYSPLERHYRGDARSLPRGSEVELSRMTAHVVETTEDGRPAAVDFDFDGDLESDEFCLLVWREGRYERFRLPSPGDKVVLPRQDFVRILLESLSQ